MRKLLTLLLLMPFCSFAQVVDTLNVDFTKVTISVETGKVTYMLTDTVQGSTKEQLYSKALEWIALKFNSAPDVIKLQDRDGGKIVAKGLTSLTYTIRSLGSDVPQTYNQGFTLDFTFREGRYRVIMSDFVVATPASGYGLYRTGGTEYGIESYIANFNKPYDFNSMARYQKVNIVTSKQMTLNTVSSSNVFFQSIKDKMHSNVTAKDDW